MNPEGVSYFNAIFGPKHVIQNILELVYVGVLSSQHVRDHVFKSRRHMVVKSNLESEG